LGSSWFWAPEL